MRFLALQAGLNGLNFSPDKIDYSWGFTFRHTLATLHYAGIISKYEFQNEINISREFGVHKELSLAERRALSREHYNKAREYIQQKNYVKSEEELEKAIKLDPKNFVAKVLYMKVQKIVKIFKKKPKKEKTTGKEGE
jgi:tetratricopeptide (TPR) repeat protein